MTSNIVESLNYVIILIRELLIYTMLESLRADTMELEKLEWSKCNIDTVKQEI